MVIVRSMLSSCKCADTVIKTSVKPGLVPNNFFLFAHCSLYAKLDHVIKSSGIEIQPSQGNIQQSQRAIEPTRKWRLLLNCMLYSALSFQIKYAPLKGQFLSYICCS